MAEIWIWRFGSPLKPGTIPGAALPFAEVARRAVKAGMPPKTPVKQRTEPGVILWTTGGKRSERWHADLAAGAMEFEKPGSKIAKAVRAAMDGAAVLQPADLDEFVAAELHESGGLRLMGSMWLVADGPPGLLDAIRGARGASVAAIRATGAGAGGEVLALAASRIGADAAALATGIEKLKPEPLRRRSNEAARLADEVERLATIMAMDLTRLGAAVLLADQRIRALLGPRRRPIRASFNGAVEPIRADQHDLSGAIRPVTVGAEHAEDRQPAANPGGPPPLMVDGVQVPPPPEDSIVERGPRISVMPSERRMRKEAQAAGYDTNTMSRAALERLFGGQQ